MFSEKAVAKLSRGAEGCWQVGKSANREKGAVKARDSKDQVQSKLQRGAGLLEWNVSGLQCKAGCGHGGRGKSRVTCVSPRCQGADGLPSGSKLLMLIWRFEMEKISQDFRKVFGSGKKDPRTMCPAVPAFLHALLSH